MAFTNKTAIVTGAGGGMGLNIARDLLAAGAHVTMIDLKPEPPADLPDGRARYLIGDVTEDTFVFKAIAQAFQETGRLDYLVNAAGVLWFGRDKSLVEIDLDLWDKILRHRFEVHGHHRAPRRAVHAEDRRRRYGAYLLDPMPAGR